MNRVYTAGVACGLGLGVALHATAAGAQTAPTGLMQTDMASSGKTEVTQEGFQAAAKAEEAVDTTNLSLAAGGNMAVGNAQSLMLNATGNFKFRRDIHQLSSQAAANYGSARINDAEGNPGPQQPTVKNFQGAVRYDIFFLKQVSGFLGFSARHDPFPFMGLDLRLNVQPGVAYYFIDVDKHQFRAELGYDLQHDVRDDDYLQSQTDITDKTQTKHNARAFVGYDNHLNAAVSFTTGLEYLQALSPFESNNNGEAERVNWRLAWGAGLTSKVADALAVSTTLRLDYDNNPLSGVKRTDLQTAVSLVYTLY